MTQRAHNNVHALAVDMEDNLVIRDFCHKVIMVLLVEDQLTEAERDFIFDMRKGLIARADAKEMRIKNAWTPSAKQMNYVQAIYSEYQ